MDIRRINVPPAVNEAMAMGAKLWISVSGGKDSQAMTIALSLLAKERGWTNLGVIHADLGRAEWPQTPAMVRKTAAIAGQEPIVVRRPRGDLVQRIQDRMEKLEGTDQPFWPSSAARYCTSDLKRGPIDKEYRKSQLLVSAEGIRAEESPARAKRKPLTLRKQITAKALRDLSPSEALQDHAEGQRVALTWNPILEWKLEDVWEAMGVDSLELYERRAKYKSFQEHLALAGWPAHPAYVFGNSRLSCALCILASLNDLRVGAKHNPELYETYLQMERQGNATFKDGWSLAEVFKEKNDGIYNEWRQPDLFTECPAIAG